MFCSTWRGAACEIDSMKPPRLPVASNISSI